MAAIMNHYIRNSTTDDKGPMFLVLTSVLAACSTLSTFLRCLARTARGTVGWDDYLIAGTTAFVAARSGLQIVSVKYGNGKHASQLTQGQNQSVTMQGWYTQLMLFPTLCLLKCSICLLLLRIKHNPRTKWTLRAIMIGLIVTNLEPVIVLLAECSPVKTYWDPDARHCWNPKIRIYSIYFQVSYSILTNLICSLMPMFVVYKIQMPFRDKLLLCGLMSLGLVATACAAVRASSLGISTNDLSYDYYIAAMWANIELHLGIIGANAACGRYIYSFLRYGRRPFDKHSHNNHSSNDCSQRSYAGYLRSVDDTIVYPERASSRSSIGQSARSEGSDIPLQAGIQKVTEYTAQTSPLTPTCVHDGHKRWYLRSAETTKDS